MPASSSGPALTPLRDEDLDQVAAGAITTTQVNGGGNTPNGQANGVPEVSVNPAGRAPPGQNA